MSMRRHPARVQRIAALRKLVDWKQGRPQDEEVRASNVDKVLVTICRCHCDFAVDPVLLWLAKRSILFNSDSLDYTAEALRAMPASRHFVLGRAIRRARRRRARVQLTARLALLCFPFRSQVHQTLDLRALVAYANCLFANRAAASIVACTAEQLTSLWITPQVDRI